MWYCADRMLAFLYFVMERLVDVLQTGIIDIKTLNQGFDLDLLQSRINAICRSIKVLSHPRYAKETLQLQQLLSHLKHTPGTGKKEKHTDVFLKTRQTALSVLEAVLELED